MKVGIPVPNIEGTIKINTKYIEYIEKSGHIPYIIPHGEFLSKHNNILNNIDVLLLPGGRDIDPIYYNENNVSSYNSNPKNDHYDRILYKYAVHNNIPVFGICRGMQLIGREFIYATEQIITNLQYNLWYNQHIDNHNQTMYLKIARNIPTHYVHKIRNNPLFNNYDEYFSVNSLHHQGLALKNDKIIFKNNEIDQMFIPLITSAFGKNLNKILCEGFVITNIKKTRVIAAGVQWHPEELEDTVLLNNFIEYSNLYKKQFSNE